MDQQTPDGGYDRDVSTCTRLIINGRTIYLEGPRTVHIDTDGHNISVRVSDGSGEFGNSRATLCGRCNGWATDSSNPDQGPCRGCNGTGEVPANNGPTTRAQSYERPRPRDTRNRYAWRVTSQDLGIESPAMVETRNTGESQMSSTSAVPAHGQMYRSNQWNPATASRETMIAILDVFTDDEVEEALAVWIRRFPEALQAAQRRSGHVLQSPYHTNRYLRAMEDFMRAEVDMPVNGSSGEPGTVQQAGTQLHVAQAGGSGRPARLSRWEMDRVARGS